MFEINEYTATIRVRAILITQDFYREPSGQQAFHCNVRRGRCWFDGAINRYS